jgi:hypothetical protein
MSLRKLSRGEAIASSSAMVLVILMFFHWFGVKAVNTSNLLFAISSNEPGKSAWEALDLIPIILVITIVATLLVSALCLMDFVERPRSPTDAVVGVLGLISAFLIFSQIVDPPTFRVETTITSEGTVQLPIVLALLAAMGIAAGSFLSMWEGSRREDDSSRQRLRRSSEVD